MKACEINTLTSERQYDTRAGFSTQYSILEILGKVYHALNRQEDALCVMINLSKAFHTFKRLILKKFFKVQGFTEETLAWFDSYFSGRKQLVCIDDSTSNLRRINVGVA